MAVLETREHCHVALPGGSTLKAATQRIVLATGPSKRDALEQVKAGEPLPINCIGSLLWFVDRVAVN